MNSKKELKKRISADYERRVKQWMASDPSQLIDAAEEITAARLIRDNIEDAITEEDANFQSANGWQESSQENGGSNE